jgi:tetratricopeptide (TPR) repeat protein
VLNNIAICQKNIGRVADAMQTFQDAAALFEELGAVAECAQLRYNIAQLLAAEGNQLEGRRRMRDARAEFERLGMVHISVITGLDLAEFAVLENNFKEVEELCRTAIRQFEKAGVAHSSEALTALTFLREAAEQRRATQEIVWHVRTYIKRLPDEPALLFAPAPLPPT